MCIIYYHKITNNKLRWRHAQTSQKGCVFLLVYTDFHNFNMEGFYWSRQISINSLWSVSIGLDRIPLIYYGVFYWSFTIPLTHSPNTPPDLVYN